MFRKTVAITSFTLQIHPTPKVFGLLLVVTALAHMTPNFHKLKATPRHPRTG